MKTLAWMLITLALSSTCLAKAVYQQQVHDLWGAAQPHRMWRNLTSFSRFPDRAATTKNGLHATNWLRSKVVSMLKRSQRHDTTLMTIDTNAFSQPSIVLRIGKSTKPGIVIGAHFDTVACNGKACTGIGNARRPGADDDGSGTVTVLEIARTLLQSNMQFERPIFLAWYGAEEHDLDGSKSVSTYFYKHHIPIAGVMQLDMTGFAKNNQPTVWISDTGHYKHVDKALTQKTYDLAKAYLSHPVNITHIDDESDHWSWQELGYKTVFPIESNCHGIKKKCPYREHTANDTLNTLSLEHMTDYLKLAIAFAVEMAKPVV